MSHQTRSNSRVNASGSRSSSNHQRVGSGTRGENSVSVVDSRKSTGDDLAFDPMSISGKRFELLKVEFAAFWEYSASFVDNSCAICRNLLSEPCIECQALGLNECELETAQCGHMFHRHCIVQWLQARSVCPLCNRPWAQAKNNNSQYKQSRHGGSSHQQRHADNNTSGASENDAAGSNRHGQGGSGLPFQGPTSLLGGASANQVAAFLEEDSGLLSFSSYNSSHANQQQQSTTPQDGGAQGTSGGNNVSGNRSGSSSSGGAGSSNSNPPPPVPPRDYS